MTASAYHVILTEVENHSFKQNSFFRHLCICKQPTLTKQWIYDISVIFLNIFYIVISDYTLLGSFLDVLFLLFTVISERHERFMRKQDRKIGVTKKSTQNNLCGRYCFFDNTLSFLYLFVAFFIYSFLTFPSDVLADIYITMGGIL